MRRALLASSVALASSGCSDNAPQICWIYGDRQHCDIRGVGDTWPGHTLMVAIGCPSVLQNDGGHGCGSCERAHTARTSAAEVRLRGISGAGGVPATQPFVKSNSSSMRNGDADCESCLPMDDQVLQCRLGANWRYCSVLNNPNLADALTSGCGNPYGPCKFWRSAIDAAGCEAPFNCADTDRLPVIAVVATCERGDAGPSCAATIRPRERPEVGYNSEQPAWVLGPPQYPENLIGGVMGEPRSRTAQGIY